MRRLPSENMLGTFGKHTLETQLGSLHTDVIAIDKARVAQYFRSLIEILFDFGYLLLDISSETLLVGQRRKAMRIRLCKKLYASGIIELLEFLKHLWSMQLQLLNTYTRKRESHFESLSILAYRLLDGIESRHIAALCYIGDSTFVLVIVIVIMISSDIKETISFQMDNLVYLKI